MSAITPPYRVEQIGNARLYLGDCLDVIPILRDVACVLTDPPFGIEYRSAARHRLASWSGSAICGDADTSARDALLAAIPAEIPKLVFGSRKAPLPIGCKMILTWDKGSALGMGDLSIPWKPSTEEIYVLGKGFTGRRDEGSVIYHPPVQAAAKKGRVHPNEKPVGLLAKLLRKMPEGLVCDPFMGSASCGEAAIKMGRAFVGVEIDPEYFRIACERMHALTLQGDLLGGVTSRGYIPQVAAIAHKAEAMMREVHHDA